MAISYWWPLPCSTGRSRCARDAGTAAQDGGGDEQRGHLSAGAEGAATTGTADGLSKLIVEIVLLSSVESAAQDEADVLIATAKQHRVDVAKLRKTIEMEFASKQAKRKKTLPAKIEKTTKAP